MAKIQTTYNADFALAFQIEQVLKSDMNSDNKMDAISALLSQGNTPINEEKAQEMLEKRGPDSALGFFKAEVARMSGSSASNEQALGNDG